MKKAATTKIAMRGLVVTGLIVVVGVATYIFPSTSTGYTFATVVGLLQIDSQASYNGNPVPSATWSKKDLVPGSDKFFNFNDIKPGDHGENTISMHVEKNAWLCMDFTHLTSLENGVNEPESHVDVNAGGELAAQMEFFAWRDDGDNIFELGETPLFGTSTQSAVIVLASTTYAIADALTGTACLGGATCYVGISWCAGNLGVNLATTQITCDATTIGNEAQTDKMSVDISIRAEGSDKTSFTCTGEIPPPPPPPPPGGGLGEQIGLFVKCQIIANFGWPLPKYRTECPGGFSTTTTTTTSTTPPAATTTRGTRTR